jgi:hypothetical protein
LPLPSANTWRWSKSWPVRRRPSRSRSRCNMPGRGPSLARCARWAWRRRICAFLSDGRGGASVFIDRCAGRARAPCRALPPVAGVIGHRDGPPGDPGLSPGVGRVVVGSRWRTAFHWLVCRVGHPPCQAFPSGTNKKNTAQPPRPPQNMAGTPGRPTAFSRKARRPFLRGSGQRCMVLGCAPGAGATRGIAVPVHRSTVTPLYARPTMGSDRRVQARPEIRRDGGAQTGSSGTHF